MIGEVSTVGVWLGGIGMTLVGVWVGCSFGAFGTDITVGTLRIWCSSGWLGGTKRKGGHGDSRGSAAKRSWDKDLAAFEIAVWVALASRLDCWRPWK